MSNYIGYIEESRTSSVFLKLIHHTWNAKPGAVRARIGFTSRGISYVSSRICAWQQLHKSAEL